MSSKLTEEEQIFIVSAHADYLSLSQIRDSFQEKFGREISLTLVAYYNPENAIGGTPAKRWVDMFNDLRTRAHERIRDIPVANQVFRMRMYQRIVDETWKHKPHVAMEAMERAARELGQWVDQNVHVEGGVDHRHLHDHEHRHLHASKALESLSDDAYDEILTALTPPRSRLPAAVSDDTAEEQNAVAEVGVDGARDMDS